jgi:hypothetical protein
MEDRNNAIAYALRIIGWSCLVFGFLLGIIAGTSTNEVLSGITYIIYGIIFCAIFLGFSEVISLLQGIYDQGVKKEEKAVEKVITNESKEISAVLPEAEAEIRDFYAAGHLKPSSIQATTAEDVYRVEVNGETQYIELGGFKPKVHTKTDFHNRL